MRRSSVPRNTRRKNDGNSGFVGNRSPAHAGRALAAGREPACAVRACRADAEFLSELGEILACADVAAAQAGAECLADGDCCKFDLTGQRLFASTGELAMVTEQAPPHPEACLALRCPYQEGALCTARDRRPLGCRTFFCERAWKGAPGTVGAAAPPREWSGELYERLHAKIRDLHRRRGLPYAYAELTASLAELLGFQR